VGRRLGSVDHRDGAASRMTLMVPTEREGAADQLPVPPNGDIRANLVLAPAQGMFGLLVALLNAPATVPPKRYP